MIGAPWRIPVAGMTSAQQLRALPGGETPRRLFTRLPRNTSGALDYTVQFANANCNNKRIGIYLHIYNFFSSSIVDNMRSTRHIWFIGDELLDQSANSLRKLKNEPIFDASKPELYIYKEYHVQAFHDNEVKQTYNNLLRKVRNNFTMALNLYPAILPQYLVILMGNNYIHDSAFIEFEFKQILKRMLNDIGRLIAARREQIPRKAQNIIHSTEVFVMRPLPKPESALRGDKKFKNARRSINAMLDKLSKTYDFKPLNIDEINCSQKALFEKKGQLSDYGRERMWFSISEFIRRKDKQLDLAITKHCVAKEDVGTQFPENLTDDQSGNVEQYYTRPRPNQSTYQEATRMASYNRTSRTFDDYHRQYDWDGYDDRHYAEAYSSYW